MALSTSRAVPPTLSRRPPCDGTLASSLSALQDSSHRLFYSAA